MKKVIILVLLMYLTACSSTTGYTDITHQYDFPKKPITDEYTVTDYDLDSYDVLVLEMDVCSEWATYSASISGYTITYTNPCSRIGGIPYISFNENAVDVFQFITKIYDLENQGSQDALGYLGIVITNED